MAKRNVFKITLSGLLIAIGILIPIFSPVKILIEPASFTLASHVPIIIAMFISPAMAIAVAIGTTIGFFLGGFPLVVVFRAASHILFLTLGSLYIRKYPLLYKSGIKFRVFSFVIGLIHAFGEIVVASIFYLSGNMLFNLKEYSYLVLLLVGLGTVIHSMVDFELANVVMLALRKSKHLVSPGQDS